MPSRITRVGKRTLVIESPVMNAAGTLGFGDEYRDLIDLGTLGAFVTNPITFNAWSPAGGTRVVPLDGGVLVHTGLPNPGVRAVVDQHLAAWERMEIPIIAHIVINQIEEVRGCIGVLDRVEAVEAIEIGLADDISAAEAQWYVSAAKDRAEKPILARIPFGTPFDVIKAAVDGGADALVISAPPRGTARDSSGRLVAGRVYSPIIKPIVLRMVGQLARQVRIPLIACGGVHSAQDARDFIEAGAAAVQIDSLAWVDPAAITEIARDLGGMITTQQADGDGLEEFLREYGDNDKNL